MRLVWGTEATSSIDGALSELRGVFGSDLVPPRLTELDLNPKLVDCDAVEFLVAAKEGRRRDALGLYRGPFLQNYREKGATSGFNQWVRTTRANLQQTFLELCEAECANAAANGDWAEVTEVATRGLALEPTWAAGEMWLSAVSGATTSAGELAGRVSPLLESAGQLDAVAVSPAAHEPEGYFAAPQVTEPREGSSRESTRRLGAGVLCMIFGGLLLCFVGYRAWRPHEVGKPLNCRPGEAKVQLVREIYVQNARIRSGTAFTKGWVLQNTGRCAWPANLEVRHESSSGSRLSMSQAPFRIASIVPPGDTLTLNIPMRAPSVPGTYAEAWSLVDPRLPRSITWLTTQIFVPRSRYVTCTPGQARARLLMQRYANRTALPPGSSFTWNWALKNVGDCAWPTGVRLTNVSRNSAGHVLQRNESEAARQVEPLESYTFLVPAQTPATPGFYREEWRVEDSDGHVIPVDDALSLPLIIEVLDSSVVQTSVPVCGAGEAILGFLNEDILDESVIEPSSRFVKRWTVVNDGPCALDSSFHFRHRSHTGVRMAEIDALSVQGIFLPGTIYTFEVPMRAPMEQGSYREDWGAVDATGRLIQISNTLTLWVKITVP